MNIIDILLIGIALAMDCFAVSITQGLSQRSYHPRAIVMVLFFGLFQGGMPLIGYLCGSFFASFFSRFAPWVALALLVWIGGKMAWESLHPDEDENTDESVLKTADWTLSRLVVLAVATSIDALATGVIFIPCHEWLWIGVGVIALCSWLFSALGYSIGVISGRRIHVNVELIGGIILIALGVKIWLEGVVL